MKLSDEAAACVAAAVRAAILAKGHRRTVAAAAGAVSAAFARAMSAPGEASTRPGILKRTTGSTPQADHESAFTGVQPETLVNALRELRRTQRQRKKQRRKANRAAGKAAAATNNDTGGANHSEVTVQSKRVSDTPIETLEHADLSPGETTALNDEQRTGTQNQQVDAEMNPAPEGFGALLAALNTHGSTAPGTVLTHDLATPRSDDRERSPRRLDAPTPKSDALPPLEVGSVWSDSGWNTPADDIPDDNPPTPRHTTGRNKCCNPTQRRANDKGAHRPK